MKYNFEKETDYTFDKAVERITEELKKEGFGILARIDMHNTLKEKLNVEFRKYSILEACNPPFAYKSLQAEANIGIMLPCNVVVQQISDDKTSVAVVNPVSAMRAVNNPGMDDIAKEIQTKLKNALDKV
jgi:uncharacterized protein (DUF302 family)